MGGDNPLKHFRIINLKNNIMEEETKKKQNEETIDNQEENIGDENTDNQDVESLKKQKNKLYARTKTAEAEAKEVKAKNKELEAKNKELEEELNKLKGTSENKEEETTTPQSAIDPIELARQVKKLSQLDDEEIAYAQVLAKGTGKKIEDVLEAEDFKLWSSAYKEKKKTDNKTPNPTNKFEGEGEKDEMFEKFSSNLPKGFDFKNK